MFRLTLMFFQELKSDVDSLNDGFGAVKHSGLFIYL